MTREFSDFMCSKSMDDMWHAILKSMLDYCEKGDFSFAPKEKEDWSLYTDLKRNISEIFSGATEEEIKKLETELSQVKALVDNPVSHRDERREKILLDILPIIREFLLEKNSEYDFLYRISTLGNECRTKARAFILMSLVSSTFNLQIEAKDQRAISLMSIRTTIRKWLFLCAFRSSVKIRIKQKCLLVFKFLNELE